MAERRSLEDRPKSSPSKGGKSGDKGKLFLALGLFVVAGVVYLWLSGYIGGPPKSPPATAEEVASYEQQKKAVEEAQKGPRPPVVGGD